MNENTIITTITDKIDLDLSNEIISNMVVSDDELINKYVSEIFYQFNKTNYKNYAHLEVLAIDKSCGGGKKLYLGFNNKSNKVKFIQSYKYKNLYEIITNEIVKPYFDIDYKKPSEYINDERAKQIINRLIVEFNGYFRLPINSDNTYCYAKRDDESGLIKSIHIVISGFKTTKTALKDFVSGINKQRHKNSFKKMVGGLDGKVYELRKLFSLPHQRKLGKKEFFEWFYCFENDKTKYDDGAIYHYLINDVKNCEFNDYKDNPFEYTEITENKIIAKEEKTEKLNKIITNDEMVKLNPSNLVDKLLEILPQEFFDNNIWKHISRQIVMNKFNGWEKWLEESADRTNDYSVDNNNEWGNNLDDKYATTDITTHLNKLNDEYNLGLIWDKIDYFTDDLMEWICKIANTTHTDLKASIKRFNEKNNKKKEPTTEMMVGNNYVFNMKKQTLINEINQTINHYGMETHFDNQYGVDDTRFKLIKQDEIIEEMKKFLNSINRLSGWKMLWGSGKTHFGVNTIKQHALENNMRILFLTENNNLNLEMTASLGGISHLDIKEYNLTNEDVIDGKIIVSSLESLKKILYYNGKTPFDIIIFDEFESIINHFISTTFKKVSAFEVSEIVRELLRDANKVICLDCDLSEDRMKIINNIFIDDDSDDSEIQLYKCEHNSWEDYEYKIHTNKNKMTDKMIKDIYVENKRVLYPSNSKADARAIYKLLIRQTKNYNNDKNIMIISSDGVEYYINSVKYNAEAMKDWNDDIKEIQDKEELNKLRKNIEIGKYASVKKDKLFQNVENAIKELQIEVLIYSPSMTCGISFGNSKTDFMFDKLYGYATKGSICARAFLQMLHRCRNLKDKEMNLHIKNGLTKITQNVNSSKIEPLIMKHQQLKFCDDDDKWWENIDMEKFVISKFYKEIIISNVIEKVNSERNFIQETLGRMIENHNLNVSIKHIYKSTEQNEASSKDEYDDLKKINKSELRMLLQLEPKITESQYKHYSSELNDKNDSVDNRHKVNKYYLLDRLNINNSNNKFISDEREQDKIKQEDGYWCVYEKENDIIKKQVWKNKSDMMGETNGIFKNYSIDADGDCNYYGGEEYCDIDDINYAKYDKDMLIQHSKSVAEIYRTPYMERFYRLNNNILTGFKYDGECDESNFTLKDIKNNKLKLIKSVMDLMGIDRNDLLYNRKILSNSDLKKLFEKNTSFIVKQLIKFYNEMDTDKIETNSIMNINEFNASNRKHFKYVKDIITSYLAFVGITHFHYNKHGKRGLYVYDNDDCLTAFQYELCGKKTFINTYYDTIKNDIHYYLYKTQRTINDVVNKTKLEENMMVKKRYKRLDKKFETRQNAIFKRNRYITIQIGKVEKSLKLPFNLMTADYITDKNDNVIILKDKTNQERVEIYLKIEFQNQIQSISYNMDDLTKKTNDIRYYKYVDIEWNKTDNDYYVKEQVEKFTTDKNKKDNIIETKSQTTEDVVNDILNDVIDAIVMKDEFKNMVNDEINIGGEQDKIKQDYDNLINDEIDTSLLNSNDTQFEILRPNIKIY
tara:strand:- start:644 stop:5245 length:4602 start_codon:yes stop_codon:yes gene_type:complete